MSQNYNNSKNPEEKLLQQGKKSQNCALNHFLCLEFI